MRKLWTQMTTLIIVKFFWLKSLSGQCLHKPIGLTCWILNKVIVLPKNAKHFQNGVQNNKADFSWNLIGWIWYWPYNQTLFSSVARNIRHLKWNYSLNVFISYDLTYKYYLYSYVKFLYFLLQWLQKDLSRILRTFNRKWTNAWIGFFSTQ